MKRSSKTSKQKSVKFNLRKNTTRKFSKQEKTLRKKNQKKVQRKSIKKQQKQRRQKKQQKQRKSLRKNMKGGAIPFSEISEVYGNIKHSFNDAIEVFKDTPATVPNNPNPTNVDPNVSKQFLTTESASQKFASPDLQNIYKNAYSS